MKKRYFSSRKEGLTLVELLVVIFILGVLLSLLLPAISSARHAVIRMNCANQMRQLGLAIHAYLDVHEAFPPTKTTYVNASGTRRDRHNILTLLLPYLEQNSCFMQIDLDKNWNLAANRAGINNAIDVFRCPEAPRVRSFGSATYYTTDYSTCYLMRKAVRTQLGLKERSEWTSILLPDASDSNEFHRRAPVTVSRIFDGLSCSMLLFECGGRPFKLLHGGRRGDPNVTPLEPLLNSPWADPGSGFVMNANYLDRSGRLFNNCNSNEIFSLHSGGANFLYGDSSVRFHRETIEPEVFASAFTCAAFD